MARIHDLTPDQRALVLLLRHEFGYSYREIALKTKMSKTILFSESLNILIVAILEVKSERKLIKVAINH